MADLIQVHGGMPLTRPSTSPRTSSRRTRRNTLLFWALFVLLALAPLPFGSARAIVWGVWAAYIAIIGLLYFFALARHGEPLRATPGGVLTTLFAILCAYLVVQLLPLGEWTIVSSDSVVISAGQISIAPPLTLLMLVRQLSYGLFFLLVMQVMVNDARRAMALKLLLFTVVAYGLHALASLQLGDTILGLEKWAYQGSATGTFVNRNSFATFIGFGAILAVTQGCSVLVRQAERNPHDGRIQNFSSSLVLYGLSFAFLLVVLVATQSRMGLFATLAGSSVVVAITLASLRSARLFLLLAPAGLLMLAGALYLIGGGLLERIEDVRLAAVGRGDIYRQILDLIAMRPWLGFGGGSFELAFPLVHQLPLTADLTFTRGHNTYLTLWSELGLVAGSLPILAIGYVGFRLLRGLIRGAGSWTAQTAALGAITLGAIHSLVDFSLEIQANVILFLAVLAAGVASTASGHKRTG